MQPKKIAQLIHKAADDKQAVDPIILDISKLTSVAHYFVIAHGNSDRHVKAIADNIIDTLKAKKVQVLHKEGMETGQWVLLDYGAVIAHIFYKAVRDFYGLERLWGEAPKL